MIIPRDNDEQNGHVDPAEQPELLLEITALERQDEADEAKGVEGETNESVVGRKHRQLRVREDDMLKSC